MNTHMACFYGEIQKMIQDFIIANYRPCLTLCLPMSSADNLGKQFGPRSGPTICRA